MPISPNVLKNSPGFEPRLARVLSPSAQQALWPIQWFSPLKHRYRLSMTNKPLQNLCTSVQMELNQSLREIKCSSTVQTSSVFSDDEVFVI